MKVGIDTLSYNQKLSSSVSLDGNSNHKVILLTKTMNPDSVQPALETL